MHHLQQIGPTANLHRSPAVAGILCELCNFGQSLFYNPMKSAFFSNHLRRQPNLTRHLGISGVGTAETSDVCKEAGVGPTDCTNGDQD
jgi:hypothetical protein